MKPRTPDSYLIYEVDENALKIKNDNDRNSNANEKNVFLYINILDTIDFSIVTNILIPANSTGAFV